MVDQKTNFATGSWNSISGEIWWEEDKQCRKQDNQAVLLILGAAMDGTPIF